MRGNAIRYFAWFMLSAIAMKRYATVVQSLRYASIKTCRNALVEMLGKLSMRMVLLSMGLGTAMVTVDCLYCGRVRAPTGVGRGQH